MKTLLVLLLLAVAGNAQTVRFSGTATCPGKPPLAEGKSPGGTIVVLTATCNWKGLQLGGQALVSNTSYAAGITNVAGTTWTAEGFDTGTLANGDQYQGKWVEIGTFSGANAGSSVKWSLVAGSGVIQGIQGTGTINCGAPKNNVVSCTASGSYSLRRPAATKGVPQK